MSKIPKASENTAHCKSSKNSRGQISEGVRELHWIREGRAQYVEGKLRKCQQEVGKEYQGEAGNSRCVGQASSTQGKPNIGVRDTVFEGYENWNLPISTGLRPWEWWEMFSFWQF